MCIQDHAEQARQGPLRYSKRLQKLNSISRESMIELRRLIFCTTLYRNPMQASTFFLPWCKKVKNDQKRKSTGEGGGRKSCLIACDLHSQDAGSTRGGLWARGGFFHLIQRCHFFYTFVGEKREDWIMINDGIFTALHFSAFNRWLNNNLLTHLPPRIFANSRNLKDLWVPFCWYDSHLKYNGCRPETCCALVN